ncbi:CinA family protein [Apilactobacillus xinyiensis]|uniref:Nicotinamide-nucleotide amidohydrolase family protein n=1 Tax=Apilactobacillus xinyiensis TaxID=2841032 RepID=A0ABT0I1U2_9LACO|nr:nicotinamide-nucleotide amidohydrolase family protein [Apilactobacillus xinyiensis]MCK8624683.1 nicotinamide-nucleotide amidohydrolase family protein [Apilactobacillus xinyiensis]MCL0318798.1 nicotinamide-nucleotide amidohydrolase family protein [Apilactobacillus xinyiensis]
MITNIDKKVIRKLINDNISITAAESLTAGLFQEVLGEVSGVSKIFSGGFVTYSNDAKIKLLGVPKNIVNEYGVVSAETAKQMAKKSQEIMQTDLSVSFTGVAGPDKLENQLAGTVYIGVAYKDSVTSQLFNFDGDRDTVRLKSVLAGLNLIEKIINN